METAFVKTLFLKTFYSQEVFWVRHRCLRTTKESTIAQWLGGNCRGESGSYQPQKKASQAYGWWGKRRAYLKQYELGQSEEEEKAIGRFQDLLDGPTEKIEAYDISNISGTDSMPRGWSFQGGLSQTKTYRL